MSTQPPGPDHAPASAGRTHPSRLGSFFVVWGSAWFLITLGGGGCGAVCAGVASAAFFFWTIPGGMCVGAILGVPLGLVIAVVVATRASPPIDPTLLTRRLESVGILIAGLVIGSTNLYLIGAATFFGDLDHRVLVVPALIANGVIAVLAAAAIGRECGHDLGVLHLKRFGFPSPKRGPILRPLAAFARARG